jgi:DNA-binding protein
MRRQLAFAIANVKKGEDVTISAQANNISKAIRMAEIIKRRVNLIHQVNSFKNSTGKIKSQL